LVAGVVEEEQATVDAPIDRDRFNRQRMAATRGGRDAVTHFSVMERFKTATLLDVEIETGRTHQIRVHLAFIGFPVVGDAVYGNKVSTRIADEIGISRQWLHATSLTFDMPGTGERRTFTAPLPADLEDALDSLRQPEDVGDESA
ncbi:MAG TPA: pseudouridine synthase, partial [Thermomicrobiales bacterium]|nr:pseudouridine synthase [Thermomicrobiales bacterium]